MSNKSVNHVDGGKGVVLIEGYLRKLKTMKKKYFVLRGESVEASARLEYYDNEKKYRSGHNPKRIITLKSCFNIHRKEDTKQKHVIALYTMDEVFCVVLENEKQQEDWLRLLLLHQTGGEDVVDGEPRPYFEHVWKVRLQDKGLGDSRNLVGPYYICLSDHTLTLVKSGTDNKQDKLEFPLTHIRSCGATESFFYIEAGRQSVTGAGELWMLTDDPNIAKNMNSIIKSAFKLRQIQNAEQREGNTDPHRKRSSSATEMNRPTLLLQRRQTHGGGKPLLVSPYSGNSWNSAVSVGCGPTVSISAPPPSDASFDNVSPLSSGFPRAPLLTAPRSASHRRHSVSAVSSCAARIVACDVTDGSSGSGGGGGGGNAHGSNPGTVISHQRTKSCPVSDSSSVPLIVEPHRVLSQSHVGTLHPPDADRRGNVGGLRRPMPGKCSTGTRERSDSMPSRNRTTSEGTHKALIRPASMHMRGVSYSPPGPCYTDSAGSSLSIDESETDRMSHAATPDDHTILEEIIDDSTQWSNDPDIEAERLDAYLPMSRPPASLSLPIHPGRKISAPGALHGSPSGSNPCVNSDYLPMSPVDSGRKQRPGSSPSLASDYLPMSPVDSNRRRDVLTGTSPSNTSDYFPMSPADSRRYGTTGRNSPPSDYLPMSPGDGNRQGSTASMDYLPMSPAESLQRVAHSRDSSLAEDGYVPMAPAHSDDGYVDMDPLPTSHRFMLDDHHSDMSPGSSCSVTSGTPSSDHFLLEKVSAYFTPSEEEEGSTGRPARTYSFGSQTKGRLDVLNAAEVARVRAFSMGTQQRPNAHKLATRPFKTGKFSSAPLLSSSCPGTSRQQHDPMADLMEIDFTKNARHHSRYKNLPVVENLVAQANSSADSGYMDMSSKSPPRASPPKMSLTKHLFSPPDGKSMVTRKTAIISSSALKTIGERPDIKPQKFPNTSSANINILPSKHHAPDKVLFDNKSRSCSERSDNYMEMNMKPVRKCSVDSNDYLPMYGGKRGSELINDYVPMSGGKKSSNPIAIVGPSSPTPRKSLSTTPPKPPSFLPLNNSTGSLNLLSMRSSAKRKTRKKTERRDSKENVSTPTAIFPLSLNSPQSPKKVYQEPDATSLVAPLSQVLRIDRENAAAEAADDGDYALMRPGVSTATTSQKWMPLNRKPDSDEAVCKPCRLRTASTTSETHCGVTRQVSTSSSSSTEVMSVKEGIGSEKDITYASLDLGSEGEEPRSPRPSPAPSPAPAPAPVEPFPYAEIDFQKSESLRAPASSFNRKIRH